MTQRYPKLSEIHQKFFEIHHKTSCVQKVAETARDLTRDTTRLMHKGAQSGDLRIQLLWRSAHPATVVNLYRVSHSKNVRLHTRRFVMDLEDFFMDFAELRIYLRHR